MPVAPPPTQVVRGHFPLAHPPVLLEVWGHQGSPVCRLRDLQSCSPTAPHGPPMPASPCRRVWQEPLFRLPRGSPGTLLHPCPQGQLSRTQWPGLSKGPCPHVDAGQEADPASLGHSSWAEEPGRASADVVQACSSGKADGRWEGQGATRVELAADWEGWPARPLHAAGAYLRRDHSSSHRGHSPGAQR